MRILIDECLDWRLGRALTGHDCVSVQKMGWSGIKNGRLLALAQAEFDVFLTADRNLGFQQDTTKFQIAVVVLVAASTQLNKTLPLMPKVLAFLPELTRAKSQSSVHSRTSSVRFLRFAYDPDLNCHHREPTPLRFNFAGS